MASERKCPAAWVNAQVRRLVALAGIRPGTWKFIRRGSGSDVEAQVDGAGHRHLGNTPAVFAASYGDESIIGRRTPSPRELLLESMRATGRTLGAPGQGPVAAG